MQFIIYMDTELGRLCLGEDGTGITQLTFEAKEKGASRRKAERETECVEQETPLLKKARKQVEEYLVGSRTEFDLPLSLHGTDFQERVWQALLTIPYGETRTYGEIAKQIGNSKACRAVGMANHNNPVSLIVPCHRVIGSDHSLVGYGGGLPIKEKLLSLERENRG